ncbi:hypothetical protein NBRC10513_003650 [Rhodotorula toruloides]
MPRPSAENLLWIDCEMTGLNPYLPREGIKEGEEFFPDRILEVGSLSPPSAPLSTILMPVISLKIACIATDKHLNQLDEGVEYIVKTDKEVLDRMNEWCINQHGKTGLTQACLDSKYTMQEVDKHVSDYVAKHFPPDAPALLAGNSVHADKAFINKDLPLLASKLHYRILDVSSLKEIGRRWYPSLDWTSKKDEAEHRALSDIKASIAELKRYRENLFKPVEEEDAAEKTAARLGSPVRHPTI